MLVSLLAVQLLYLPCCSSAHGLKLPCLDQPWPPAQQPGHLENQTRHSSHETRVALCCVHVARAVCTSHAACRTCCMHFACCMLHVALAQHVASCLSHPPTCPHPCPPPSGRPAGQHGDGAGLPPARPPAAHHQHPGEADQPQDSAAGHHWAADMQGHVRALGCERNQSNGATAMNWSIGEGLGTSESRRLGEVTAVDHGCVQGGRVWGHAGAWLVRVLICEWLGMVGR